MVDRQHETAVVGPADTREEVGVDPTRVRGETPHDSLLRVDRADGPPHVPVIEPRSERGVLVEGSEDVLIIGQRIEPAVIRSIQSVLERPRALVDEVVAVRDDRGVALAARLRRAEQIVEVRRVVAEAHLPRRVIPPELHVERLVVVEGIVRRGGGDGQIDRVEPDRIGEVQPHARRDRVLVTFEDRIERGEPELFSARTDRSNVVTLSRSTLAGEPTIHSLTCSGGRRLPGRGNESR